MAVIDFPILYIPDPTKGKPLYSGQIFVGVEDLDPEIPANQKQLNVVQEDGTIVPVAQPFILSSGGVPVYNGAPVRLDVDGNYSIKILSKQGAQVYYVENVIEGNPVTSEDGGEYFVRRFDTLADAVSSGLIKEGDSLSIKERTSGNGGGGFWDVRLTSTVSPNTYNTVQCTLQTDLSLVLRDSDRVNAKQLGAIGDGVSDDLGAINFSISEYGYAYLPSGIYNVTSEPVEPFNIYGEGVIKNADVISSPTFQAGDQQILKSYRERTFGTFESAVAQSITANKGTLGQTKNNTSVNGTDAEGLSSRTGRDHVAQYISINSFAPLNLVDGITSYTATTVTNPAIDGIYELKVGMVIDTRHSDRFTAIIESIDIDTNTITVGGWYRNSDQTLQTPANGIGCIINPNSKVFGQNITVFADGDGSATGAQEAAGMEVSVITPPSPTPIPGTIGFDLALIQNSHIDIGYQVRGLRNISYFSNDAGGNGGFGFYSKGDSRGFYGEDCNIPMEFINGGVSIFSLSQLGVVTHSGAHVQNAVATKGSSAQQVSTSVVLDTLSGGQQGGRVLITGFNTSGGAQYVEEGVFRVGVYIPNTKSDGTGLNATLSMSGANLTLTVSGGTLQYVTEITKL